MKDLLISFHLGRIVQQNGFVNLMPARLFNIYQGIWRLSFHLIVSDMHIHHVGFHKAEVFIRLGLLDKSGFVSLHAFQPLMGEKGITLPARGLGDMILCQPVDELIEVVMVFSRFIGVAGSVTGGWPPQPARGR